MNQQRLLEQFIEFLTEYNAAAKDEIWQQQSNTFKAFWSEKVLNDKVKELDDFEVDSIIRFIDRQARGNTPSDEAIAKVMIAQGVWRKMFNQLKSDKNLGQLVDQIMRTSDAGQKVGLIDELYKYNEKNRNSLTGQSGNAINSFMFLWAPAEHVSIVSLKDRQRLIQFLEITEGPNFLKDSAGEKMVRSNDILVSHFSKLFGSQYSPRTICTFFYHSPIKDQWRSDEAIPEEKKEEDPPFGPLTGDPALFYMESQLEDFLMENWDKTELGKKYDLIEEDGEEISQQYRTGIGKIDILAQDKETKHLVVIELKKNQTSDDTVGQLARYMGWLEEHKTNGTPTKGIIIAARYDKRLYYALKKLKDTEVYLYRVDFRLEEFKDDLN
jgi:hypothetical protein